MNTFQLECFTSVATSLNFARAAEELNVTQPAVTHQIRSLEDELGVKLFNRTTRSVSLTHDGEMFLPEANDLIVRLHALRNRFLKGDEKDFVPLQIGCMSDTLFGLLPDVLYRLSSAEPGIHPILRTFPPQQITKNIGEGTADVVLGVREKLPEGGMVKYRELTQSPVVCVCDRTHPLSEQAEVRLEDMQPHSLICLRPTVCASEITALQSELGKWKKPESIFLCDSLPAAFALARAGIGALMIPRVFVPESLPGLIKLNVSNYPPISFGVYYRQDCTDLQKEFMRLLKEQFDRAGGTEQT